MALVFVVFAVVYTGRGLYHLDKRFEDGWSFTYLKKSSQWLQDKVPAGTLVYNARWDDWPALFYFAPNLSYVSGLDLRFFNDYKITIKQWEEIYRGTSADPATVIKKTFGANYVLMSHFYPSETMNMFKTHQFPVLYEDDKATIYAVP